MKYIYIYTYTSSVSILIIILEINIITNNLFIYNFIIIIVYEILFLNNYFRFLIIKFI